MEDELLVALKNRLRIGTRRIDPELQHAAGAGERAGNPALALDLAGIADIDDHDVAALRSLDGVGGTQRFDLGIRLVDQRLDAAMDGLGHELTFGSITLQHGRPAPSPVQLGFTRVGHLNLSKSDISDFD